MRFPSSPATLRQLFELSGIVPLAVFVLVHVVSYGTSLFGATHFGVPEDRGVLFAIVDLALIWLPLAFHTAYGVKLSFAPLESDPGERRSDLGLRISGMAAFAFIVAHTVLLDWPLITGERNGTDVHQMLAAELSATTGGVPVAALIHLLGVAVVALHLGLGLARFVEKWGLARRVVARRAATVVSVLVFAMGAASIVELATGAALPRFLY